MMFNNGHEHSYTEIIKIKHMFKIKTGLENNKIVVEIIEKELRNNYLKKSLENK